MKDIITIMTVVLTLCACGSDQSTEDATGTFEATEVTVSAEQNGRLLQWNVEDGSRLTAGTQVGLIDTVQLALKARQIGATRLVYTAQRPDISAQVAVIQQQLRKAEQDEARYAALVRDGAANRKLLDDARSQVLVLKRQLAAQQSTLGNSSRTVDAQVGTANAEKYIVADQLRKCHVVSPISGTVLENYVESGEYATVGKPLFKMADMDRVFLRAYLTSFQLKDVKLGQQVIVYTDYGNGQRRKYKGQIVWISESSEFTPKTILTDDERADLVYAVKIAVKNDGYIRLGMYGEVKL